MAEGVNSIFFFVFVICKNCIEIKKIYKAQNYIFCVFTRLSDQKQTHKHTHYIFLHIIRFRSFVRVLYTVYIKAKLHTYNQEKKIP